MKVTVIGAGAWGTALAANAAAQGRHRVGLWARNPEQLQALQAQRSTALKGTTGLAAKEHFK
jgi:glycerol-3-phosphate dehydrogenase (NAD(P)+)